MSVGVFKVHDNEDGSVTLWYSYGAKLTKVVRYDPDYFADWSNDEIEAVQERDAAIFMRGINRGK